MRVVLDTNILLTSFSRKSASSWVFASFESQRYELAYTTEILAEYEEKFDEHWNASVADNVITTILKLPNAIQTTVYYRLNLITQDGDDNTFVDCAFASNADHIVTDDAHFNVLKSVSFPRISVVSLAEFQRIISPLN